MSHVASTRTSRRGRARFTCRKDGSANSFPRGWSPRTDRDGRGRESKPAWWKLSDSGRLAWDRRLAGFPSRVKAASGRCKGRSHLSEEACCVLHTVPSTPNQRIIPHSRADQAQMYATACRRQKRPRRPARNLRHPPKKSSPARLRVGEPLPSSPTRMPAKRHSPKSSSSTVEPCRRRGPSRPRGRGGGQRATG